MNHVTPAADIRGPQIVDVLEAILFLADHGAIKTFDAPNKPTSAEIRKLKTAARKELAKPTFGPASRTLLEHLQLQNGLGSASRGKVDEATAALLNRLLEQFGAFPASTSSETARHRVVHGRVTRLDGSPVEGLVVRARDRDMRTFQALGKKARTGRDGRFSIRYSPSEFCRAEKGGADLVVSIFAAGADTGKPVAESETLFNAPAHAEVDFKLPNLPNPLSEFEHHVHDIQPLLHGQGPGGKDLTFADLTDADQDFIARETAIDASHVLSLRRSFIAAAQASQALSAGPAASAQASVARKNAAKPQRASSRSAEALPPEACYAWFRQGLAGDVRSALQKSTPELVALVQTAAASNLVPRTQAGRLKDLATTIDELRLDLALQSAGKGQAASVGDLLATIPNRMTAGKERIVAAALQDPAVSDADLERQLTNARFTDAEIAAVHVTRSLANLTLGQPGVMRELQKLRTSDADRSLKFLAAVTPVQWLELAYNHQAENGATPSPERYAQQMQDALEALHPTAVLAGRIESGDWVAPTSGLKKAGAFLAAHPELELRDTNLLGFVNTLKPSPDTPAIVSGLQAFQRMQNLTRSWRDTGALLDLGFSSVRDVVRMGKARFADAVAERMPAEYAAAVFDDASRVHNTAVALIGNAYAGGKQNGFGTPGQTGTPVSTDTTTAIDPAVFPNLAVLFGSPSTCECDECQGVLSPAAYLVDLLHFLDPTNGGAATGALSVLLGRRPDIADLELTCDNTKIEVPYVDLVLEVLENAVAMPIEIPAPYGFDPNVDLAQAPLSNAVLAALHAVLSRSADSIADPLSVAKSPKNLQAGTFDDWLINDGFRRWVLRSYPETLTAQRLNSSPTPLSVADYAAAVAALDGGAVLTNAWVLPRLTDPRDKNLPLVGAPTVTVLVAGASWSAAYTRAVRVTITVHGNAGKLELKTADAAQKLITSVTGSKAVLQALVSALNRKHVAAPLASLLPPSTTYQVAQDGNDWVVSLSGTVYLTYTAPRLLLASLTYQSSDPRVDALASPENRNPEAYRRTDGAVYPWSLPFNLWLEEVRVFLARRGMPRRALMERCNPATRLSNAAVVREVLALSLSQATIIIGADIHAIWDFWGLKQNQNRIVDRNEPTIVATGSWRDVLGLNVSLLLQQSGLGYRELLNVLQTQFVRAAAPVLRPSGDDCNPSKMTLAGLDTPHLDRIHRLVRFWRLIGGSIFDLDLAIAATAVHATDLDGDTLLRVAGIRRIQQDLGLPVSEIASWWSGMTATSVDYTIGDGTTQASVYERWFLNTNVTNPTDPAFALNPQRTELNYANPANPPALASASATLTAALGISQADLDALVADQVSRNEIAAPAMLSLKNLTLLFRNVSMAKGLALPIGDYLRVKSIIAADPFATPANAIEFIEQVQFVQHSDFSLDALTYLFGYTLADAPGNVMPLGWASQVLTEVRGRIQSAQAALAAGGADATESLRKALTGIGWPDSLVSDAESLLASPAGLTVQIAGAPAVTIPAALAGLITYGAADGILTGSPGMTAIQWSSLTTANGTAAVQSAIASLRAQVNAFEVALPGELHELQSFELPTFNVACPVAPAIPQDLARQCYFDAVQQQLVFVGWMSDGQHTELQRALPAAQSALADQLKARSDQYHEAAPLNRFLFDVNEAEGLFAAARTPDARVQAVLAKMTPFVARTTLVAQLSQALDVDVALVDPLLTWQLTRATALDPLLAPAFIGSDSRVTPTPDAFPAQFRALCKVHKAGLILRTLEATAAELAWLPPAIDGATPFDVLSLDALPVDQGDPAPNFEAWRRLVLLFSARNDRRLGDPWIARLQALLERDPAALTVIQSDGAHQQSFLAQAMQSTSDDLLWVTGTQLKLQWPADYQSAANTSLIIQWLLRVQLGRALGVSAQDVADAVAQLALAWPNDFADPGRLADLLELLTTVQRLGVGAAGAISLTQDAAPAGANPGKPGENEAHLARKVLRARYDPASWPANLRKVVDTLREKQRAALVSYLVANPPANAAGGGLWSQPSDLYDHFLIDPEMSPCRTSSRILHAISAVQLFIQRCTLNLEPAVSPTSIDSNRMSWAGQFRVWQANRKVFLFPENWIEPELRDDKSEIFKDLEGQLLQEELDGDRAAEILNDYLKALEDISHLAIVGLYVEKAWDALGNRETRVHTVGRTRNQPSHFYYRRWLISTVKNTWDPWERVSLEGVKSDHILPFVMRGDVYIAWPEITQLGADQGTDSTDAGPTWRVQMAWIRRSVRGWSDRLLSAEYFEHPWVYGKDENQTFTFRVRNENSGGVSIDCYGAERDTGDGLLYGAPQTAGFEDNRTFAPLPANGPWISVQITGVVYASYQGPGAGGKVWHTLQGAKVSVGTVFHGSGQQITQASQELQSDVHDSFYGNTDEFSSVTDENGVFILNLSLLAQLNGGIFSHNVGYFRDSVLQVSPTFDVTVSYSGQSDQPHSFSYDDPNNNNQQQYWSKESFKQNFIFDLEGAAPTGLSDRPVAMTPIKTFQLFAADDATFLSLATPFPTLPDGILTYGSGFEVVNPNQGNQLALDDTPNAPVVWTGGSWPYTLLRNAPFDRDTSPGAEPSAVMPAEVCVYSDRNDTFIIRREQSQTDPAAMVDHFQILLDGHPLITQLRQAAVYGAASVFDPAQQSWSGAGAADSIQSFEGHATSALADQSTSLPLPAMYFEPDQAQSPSAKYNSELFFQVPFLFGTFLSRNQRFADAQLWLQYVLNPTTDDVATAAPERYWRYLPFRQHARTTPVDELLTLLADPSVPTGSADKRDITTQIAIWLENPFSPHAIARVRPRAYEFSTVFKYLDNLIAWGDSLFRQYSTESINLATQLYILAVKLLGPRPQSIPRAHPPAPLTYRDVNNRWDDFSNAWVEIEGNLAIHPTQPIAVRPPGRQAAFGSDLSHLSNIGMLYFCVPGNDKILDYWNTLDQRLFNIRHCRTIDGVEQPVSLFQPPIDPALLVQAVAAGIDISAVVADTAAPIPYYRFNTIAQKAAELCNELRALGSALLGALEKKDAEDLALLRSGQELEMLTLVQSVKESQIAEAQANIDALLQSEQVAITRFVQYQRLLGKNGATVPDQDGADVEQSSAVRVAAADDAGDFSSLGLTKPEYDQIGYSEDALRFGTVAGIHSVVSGILYAIPQLQAGTPFVSSHFGGWNLGSAVGAAGSFWSVLERNAIHQAGRSASIGQYQRRQDDWVFQSRLALRDVQQIRKQRIAAQIRFDIATKELDNHKQQIKRAEESDRFMREKYTNRDLYQWMTQQISTVYFQAYQLAYDLAKRAERCFRFELGVGDSSFIKFGYWDNLKKGLAAGDRLALDLKRMEAAYLDQNRREYEITKHISLLQLDPGALVALRELGGCEISIPEVFFDLDFPGHYFRRLKSVGLSIPCVVGPYAGVPATLTLVKSSIRTQSTADSSYPPQGADDARFMEILAGVQTVATSSGQNDTGLFESNLRDERFLPFEGMGAISTWRIELPVDFRPFDYESIADVILHIRYTARNGGDDLKAAAIDNLKSGLNSIIRLSQAQGLTRMFSLKSDFPSQWYGLVNPPNAAASATAGLVLSRNRFPYLFSSSQIKLTITGVDVYAVPDASVQNPTFPTFLDVSVPGDPTPLGWPNTTSIGSLPGASAPTSVAVTAQEATAKWTLTVAAADVPTLRGQTDDLIFVCRYKVG